MFSYLNKIGSILDEIDGSKAEGSSDEPAASSEAQADGGQPSRGLGDLFAASSAGAVAGMAKAREAFTSLMTEEDEDTPQDSEGRPVDAAEPPEVSDQSWVMEETSRSRGEAFAFESEGNEVPRSPETCTSREAFSEDTRHEEPVRVEALTLDSMTNSQASATVEPEPMAPMAPMATANGHEVPATLELQPEVTEAPTSSMPVFRANGHAPLEEHFQAPSQVAAVIPDEPVEAAFPSQPAQAAAVIPDEPVEAAFPSQPAQAAAVIPDEPVEAAFPSQPAQAAAVIPDEPVEAAFPSQPAQAAAVIPEEPVEAAFPSQPAQAAAVIPAEPVEAAFPSQPAQAAAVIPDEPVEAAFPSQANGSSHLEAEAHAGFDSAQVFAAEVEEVRGEYEARLMGAAQQIGHLQGRIEELETEVANANAFVQQLTAKMASSSQQLTQQLQEQREATQRAEQAEAQVEALRKEVISAEQRAKAKANEDSDVALGQVRQEMERELEHLLKQKDDQLRALETKLSSSERSRQSTGRDLDFAQQEVERLQGQLEQLRSESVGKSSDHQRSVEQLTLDFQSRLESLEEQKSLEARQKHELALSLRSVEERSRSDLAQLEAQRDQLELQCTALQGQLQAEQQKSVELSVSLGEAQHRMAHLEESQGGAAEALREAKVRELQERAQVAEEKLLEAQSMRDMFAKETEMYRNELKVSRDEKTLLEEDLKQLQERLKELNVSAKAGAGQEAVLEAVQKDFEHRMERYRDEVQYLRQKCDEKERRCEQLMAEKGALSVELRMDAGPVSSAAEDIEAGVGKSTTGKAPTGRNLMRSLPLAAPACAQAEKCGRANEIGASHIGHSHGCPHDLLHLRSLASRLSGARCRFQGIVSLESSHEQPWAGW